MAVPVVMSLQVRPSFHLDVGVYPESHSPPRQHKKK